VSSEKDMGHDQLDKGGLQEGFEQGNKPTPALRATPPKEGILKGEIEAHAA
jgi:hypothetical protein